MSDLLEDLNTLRAEIADAREREDEFGEVLALCKLGDFSAFVGRRAEALESFRDALALAERFGEPALVVAAQTRMAQALILSGEGEQARGLIEPALRSARRLGIADGESRCLRMLGDLALAAGGARAIHSYRAALDAARRAAHPSLEVQAMCGLASARLARREPDAARPGVERALRLAHAEGLHFLEASALRLLGRLEREGGRIGAALRCLEDAIAIYESFRCKQQDDSLARGFLLEVSAAYRDYATIVIAARESDPAAAGGASFCRMLAEAQAGALDQLPSPDRERRIAVAAELAGLASPPGERDAAVYCPRARTEMRAAADLRFELAGELATYERDLRGSCPPFAALGAPLGAMEDLVSHDRLPPGVALLEPLGGEARDGRARELVSVHSADRTAVAALRCGEAEQLSLALAATACPPEGCELEAARVREHLLASIEGSAELLDGIEHLLVSTPAGLGHVPGSESAGA